ncbi:uncharacterized protein LOC111614350 [Centruroides sculpturatus]|uniref:uncharacterized protein LOC111614350 n=1 Tax=Centruroides sculpturatus TaxID=218467 RepID=UPI000C6D13B6|nr:uncharacterized protein LOC111614350 [Centruroides sculpturatus]
MGGRLLSWLKSFLLYRSFCIRWRGTLSPPHAFIQGLPKGSVLAPIVFTLYMANLWTALPANVTAVLYTNDLYILTSSTRPLKAARKAQLALDHLEHWATTWSLSFSATKSASVDFSAKLHRPPLTLSLNSSNIPQPPSFRILGLNFSHNFTWHAYETFLRTKVTRAGSLLKFFASRSYDAKRADLLRLIYTVLSPMAEFGAPLLEGAPNHYLSYRKTHSGSPSHSLGPAQVYSALILICRVWLYSTLV